MKKTVYFFYIALMVLLVVIVTAYLSYVGYDYYNTAIEERFYHPKHNWFKPSGTLGHGLGIVGTLMILFGVAFYIARKRYNFLAKYIRLKHLLDFHIFLCTLGPILIVFHTAFKFGGIVSIAFWSMVAVVLSGVIGRFIYIQIPRNIEGRVLTLNEIQDLKINISQVLEKQFMIDVNTVKKLRQFTEDDTNVSVNAVNRILKKKQLPKSKRKPIIKLLKKEKSLIKKIGKLQVMQKYFNYWHVAHLPFALIMLVIVIIHVVITLVFGYKWIF